MLERYHVKLGPVVDRVKRGLSAEEQTVFGMLTREMEDEVERAYEAAYKTLGKPPTRCVAGRHYREMMAPYMEEGYVAAACGVVIEFKEDVPPKSIRFE